MPTVNNAKNLEFFKVIYDCWAIRMKDNEIYFKSFKIHSLCIMTGVKDLIKIVVRKTQETKATLLHHYSYITGWWVMLRVGIRQKMVEDLPGFFTPGQFWSNFGILLQAWNLLWNGTFWLLFSVCKSFVYLFVCKFKRYWSIP